MYATHETQPTGNLHQRYLHVKHHDCDRRWFTGCIALCFLGDLEVYQTRTEAHRTQVHTGHHLLGEHVLFLGAAFGYFMLAPFTFNFLANYTIGDLAIIDYRPTLSDYLDTLIDITLGAGVAFELPMATWLLSKLGIITPNFLRTYRKYAYVVLLVLAAIITPSPDWGSQLIVVIPLVLLYEISILISVRVKKKQDEEWE